MLVAGLLLVSSRHQWLRYTSFAKPGRVFSWKASISLSNAKPWNETGERARLGRATLILESADTSKVDRLEATSNSDPLKTTFGSSSDGAGGCREATASSFQGMPTRVRELFTRQRSSAAHTCMVEDLLDVRRLDNKRVIVKTTTGSACHNDRSQDRPMIVQRHACSAARQLAQQVNGFGRQRHGDRRGTRADTQNFSNIAQKIQSLGSPFNPMPPYATSQTAATIYVT